MRISDWSSDVCSSDLRTFTEVDEAHDRPRQTDELSGADDTRMRIRGIEQHFAESIQVAAVRNTDRQHDATMATAQVAIAHRARQQHRVRHRSEAHTSELQSLMRISYAVYCLKKKNTVTIKH